MRKLRGTRWSMLAGVCAVAGVLGTEHSLLAQTPPPQGYSILTLGLTGSVYQYSSGGGTYESNTASGINALGQVIGYTNRYESSGFAIGEDAWVFNGTSTVQVGLTGTGYERGDTRGSIPTSIDASGHVYGRSDRQNSSVLLGYDAWYFNGSSTQVIGLTGSGYDYANTGIGGGTNRYGFLTSSSGVGQVTGYTNRYNASGFTLGQDSWYFNGSSTQLMGLTGSGYEYTSQSTGGGTYRSGSANPFISSGHVTGTSNRYNSSGNSLGQDAWLFNGTSTQVIGLTGSGYEYPSTSYGGGTVRAGYVSAPPTSSGQACGTTVRFNSTGGSLGDDSWYFNGTSTQLIGLTGTGYEYPSTVTGGGNFRSNNDFGVLPQGFVGGTQSRYNSAGTHLGTDTWFFNGFTTQLVNLTGSGYEYTYSGTGGGTYRLSSPSIFDTNGQFVGTSYRYNSNGTNLGADVWYFNGTSTQVIGLTGTGYEYPSTDSGGGNIRNGHYSSLNINGQATGYSVRYNTSGTNLGQDTWLFDGKATQQIGLTGGTYEYASSGTGGGNYRSSSVLSINSNGNLIGTSARYSSAGASLGTSGWYYDGTTHVTDPLEFSFRSSDNYLTTTPQFLTTNNVVLGSYELYSGTTDVGKRAFYWDSKDGFHDMGSLVKGGLTNAGWQSLSDVFSNLNAVGSGPTLAPYYILGDGQVTGENGGNSVYLFTAAPEPASLASIALAGAILLRPRRKN